MSSREEGRAGTTNDVGTSTLTLELTPPRGYLLPVTVDLAPRPYAIIHNDPTKNEFERGFVPYNVSTRQLLRDDASARVRGSSAGGAKVTFTSGAKTVYFGLSAEEVIPDHVTYTASAVQGLNTIARTARVMSVELTQDLTATGTTNLPTSPLPGDIVRAVRHGDGLFAWTIGGVALTKRDDYVVFQRTASAWVTTALWRNDLFVSPVITAASVIAPATSYAIPSFRRTVIILNSASGVFNVLMPLAPVHGDEIDLYNPTDTLAINPVEVLLNGGKTINGGVDAIRLDENMRTLRLRYESAAGDWRPVYTTTFSGAEPAFPALVAPTLLADGTITNLALSHIGADRGVYSIGNNATVLTVQPYVAGTPTAIPVGSLVPLLQLGAGALSVAAAPSGVTIQKAADRGLTLRRQWTSAMLHHFPVQNTWQLMGELNEI